MSRRIVLRPAAEADLLQARDWYEEESSKLAEAFADRWHELSIPRNYVFNRCR
jgi:plasmid stabilization system protein ParE